MSMFKVPCAPPPNKSVFIQKFWVQNEKSQDAEYVYFVSISILGADNNLAKRAIDDEETCCCT